MCVSLLSSSCMEYVYFLFFFFNDTATTEIYTLSLHDALPIWWASSWGRGTPCWCGRGTRSASSAIWPGWSWRRTTTCATCKRSEEHTSELQSRQYLVCRLLLEKKKKNTIQL